MDNHAKRTAATTSAAASTSNLRATSKPFYPAEKAFLISTTASHHLTWSKQLFDEESFDDSFRGTLKVNDSCMMDIMGRGSITGTNITLPEVLYVPELGVNFVSVAQLASMDYLVLFSKNLCKDCEVKDGLDGPVVGEATPQDGVYMVDYLRIPLGRSCLPDYKAVEFALRF